MLGYVLSKEVNRLRITVDDFGFEANKLMGELLHRFRSNPEKIESQGAIDQKVFQPLFESRIAGQILRSAPQDGGFISDFPAGPEIIDQVDSLSLHLAL